MKDERKSADKRETVKEKQKYIFKDGSIYEGRVKEVSGNVFRDGIGEQRGIDGTIYNGEWANDKMHGQGVIQFSDGIRYEGQWEDGSYKTGSMVWPDNSQLSGEWKNNVLEGTGVFIDSNKKNWNGRFVEGNSDHLQLEYA